MKLKTIPKILRQTYSSKFMQIAVEPADVCNLNCPSCMRPKPGIGFMQPETFRSIMVKLNGETKNVALYGRGEATLSPWLPEITEIAREHDCHTRLSINSCVSLSREYLARLLQNVDLFKICVDGYNQETLTKYRRGGNWKTVLANLKIISQINPSRSIKEMCVLTFRHVEGHEDKFRRLAEKFNMTRICWTLPIINWKTVLTQDEATEWLAENPKYQRYTQKNGVWHHKTARFCIPDPFICVDGTVLGCCRDRFATEPVGNILTDSLRELKRKLFFFWLKALRREFEFCRTCCWNSNKPVEIWEPVQ